MILWCDVQLTSDGVGICFPDLRINNGSDIGNLFKNRSNTYIVNGVSTTGWFSVDFTLNDLTNISYCFSHMSKNDSGSAIPLVISHEGASGEYPGCTNLAYEKAISDGADVLDCPVQMTKDGIPICLGSINLIDRTIAAQSFGNLVTNIPELNVDGIFSFSLTWSEIQSLKLGATLYRNPRNQNAGNFVALSEFLALANNATSVSGVLIRIEELVESTLVALIWHMKKLFQMALMFLIVLFK